MNIFITGASGFIGRHLVQGLYKEGGHNLFCLVRSKEKAKCLEKYNVNLIYGCITDYEDLKKKVPSVIDVIYHIAGYVSNKNLDLLQKINVQGSENICKLAKELNIDRLIYTSSTSVVSGNKDLPIQDQLPYSYTSPYGKSKTDAEVKVLEYRDKGLKVAIVRPCIIYGEHEPHFLKKLKPLLQRRLLPLVNKGKNKFHLVYVKNVIDFMIYALHNEDCYKDTYIIADKEVLTVREVMEIIGDSIGAKKPLLLDKNLSKLIYKIPFIGTRLKFFAKDRIYSIENIKKVGFIPKHKTKESLKLSCK